MVGISREEALGGLLDEYRERWVRDGDVGAVAKAIALCGWNSFPLPDWCVNPAIEALGLLNQKGGRGRANSPARRFAEMQKHRIRHRLVEFHLSQHGGDAPPTTLEGAYKMAAEALKGQNVTPEAIRKSYELIEKEKKG